MNPFARGKSIVSRAFVAIAIGRSSGTLFAAAFPRSVASAVRHDRRMGEGGDRFWESCRIGKAVRSALCLLGVKPAGRYARPIATAAAGRAKAGGRNRRESATRRSL